MPPPPPVTPSPHRFLPPSAPRIAKPTPAGGLQHNHSTHSFQTPIQQPSQRPQFVPISSSRQPTPAHRFAFPSPRPAHNGERAETPHAEPPWVQTPRLTRKLQRVESIEDPSQGTEDGGPEDNAHGNTIARTIELTPTTQDEDDEADILFAPSHHKRRRLSPPPPPSAYADGSLNSTSHPPATPTLPSHRFLPPRTPASSSITPSTTLALETSARPTFLLPSHTSANSPPRPLPDTFSPQRRGQKFVPGGLANTVRGWVIDIAHTASQPSTGASHGARASCNDGWRVRIKVTELSPPAEDPEGMERATAEIGSTMLLVRGTLDSLPRNASNAVHGPVEVRAILANQAAQKVSGVKIGRGSVVGIRPPCWDVELSGEKWIVAADWSVL
ncbi:uncharacterized protein K441DRAFT_691174 [Cenococcum geophilum 1.58]|uniref:Uncharacterized protein n=1 Tax=Cenococcum geophilum 1.58 TaxID=794803 RepID=A0ACC8ELY3_9PEZI|nr:hypothetical protein K441DRAFT_691174 [Cenococcum geophilum 1.58]